MNLKAIISFLKEVYREWSDDKASRLAAALAYYTIFSLAPLLLLIISITGFVVGESQVEGELYNQIEELIGAEGAGSIQEMVENVQRSGSGTLATVIGIGTLIWAATNVFNHLQTSLNTIWDVQVKPDSGILSLVRTRALAFLLIPAVGFLLLVSLVVDALLATATNLASDVLPSLGTLYLLQIVSAVVSLVVITLLFALIYKVLPDVKIDWRDVLIGSAVTALLFTVGRVVIGLYIGNSGTASAYGAAGSLIVILLWVYYSAQLLFLGAEFTQVWARRAGNQIEPNEYATRLDPVTRARQGLTPASERQAAARAAQTPPESPHVQQRKRRSALVSYSVAGVLAFIAGVMAGFIGKGEDSQAEG